MCVPSDLYHSYMCPYFHTDGEGGREAQYNLLEEEWKKMWDRETGRKSRGSRGRGGS